MSTYAQHIPRRPWSPDEYGATSSFSPAVGLGQHARQREPSDNSVEALDLVDYASTLRRGAVVDDYDPYVAVGRALSPSTVARPLSMQSIQHPPSLYTGSSSPSSNALHTTLSPHSVSGRTNSHYPPSSYNDPTVYPISGSSATRTNYETPNLDDEPDVSRFPPWSRDWFNPQGINHSKFIDPLPELDLASDVQSNLHPNRDLLPWASQRHLDLQVSPDVREERLRMLQKEFAADAHGTLSDSRTLIGSVDTRGRLITGGRKKRILVRVAQAVLTLITGGSSLYAALFIKVKSPADSPPPSHHFATYILYILSVVTFLAMFYLFAIRPCCCSGKREGKDDMYTAGSGMMVLPVQGLNWQKGKKEKKRDKKSKGTHASGDVQVNLIIDPRMFDRGAGHRDEHGSEDEVRDEEPGRDRDHVLRPRRRGILEGFAMESAWKIARSQLKKFLAFDIAFMILWGIQFVLILMGPRCPIGKFNGWCDAFNLATASVCFLVIFFGLNVFFDIRDLHTSKVSPRTRT